MFFNICIGVFGGNAVAWWCVLVGVNEMVGVGFRCVGRACLLDN